MLRRNNARLGLIIVALGSLAQSQAAGAQDGSNRNFQALAGGATAMLQPAQGYGRAPIGHRQPRPIDIPPVDLASSYDRGLHQEDARIDKRIVICRGC